MVVKRIFFVIFVAILFISCSDDSEDYHYELLETEDAVVPEEFEFGKILALIQEKRGSK